MILKKISEIKLNPNNPRLIKDDKFKKLVQSIKDFPEMLSIRPIVVNQDMIILGGNMRFRACKEAGIKEIPVIVTDLSEDKQREFLIKDNTSGGEWDWDMIANEWDADELEAWGLDLPIFDIKDEGTAEEDNYDVPDTIETDIVLGDLFEIGKHRLLCGDSTDIDKVELLMNGEKCNLLTDPPYGIKANKQTLGTGKKQFHRGEDWDNEVPDFFYVMALIDKAIIWGGEEKLHPTMKPIKVMEWCLDFLDQKPVLDIFSGSGSTMVAAHQKKKICYGMEYDPKYCQVIINRMQKLDPNLVIKKNGEQYQV